MDDSDLTLMQTNHRTKFNQYITVKKPLSIPTERLMTVLAVLAGSYTSQLIHISYWLSKLMEVLLVESNFNALYHANLDAAEYITQL